VVVTNAVHAGVAASDAKAALRRARKLVDAAAADSPRPETTLAFSLHGHRSGDA
jgi:hypothetical protein